jgi:8-oxo-dGTP pyrophosphatase MutT (NUDIX family)
MHGGFKKKFKLIEAAGGIVINSSGQILFIFRNGKWDLPKGKVDDNETLEQAAIREIYEECLIEELKILDKLPSTYHTYQLNNQSILKITHWFLITCNNWSKMKPQTEEGITDLKWFNKNQLSEPLSNTYPNIHYLINYYQTLTGA